MRGLTGAGQVHVTLRTPPPVAIDMRPVDKWRASIGHQVARALRARHSPAELRRSHVALVLDGPPRELAVTATLADLPVTAAPGTDISVTAAPGTDMPLAPDARHGPVSPTELLCTLSSFDAYFYFDAAATAAAETTAAAVQALVGATEPACVSTAVASAAVAVLSMVQANALLPGVLVLTGPAAHTAAVLAGLQGVLPAAMGAPVHTAAVTVRGEHDTRVVLGTPWDFPRGGLFKFIDDVNNPAGDHRRAGQEYAVVVAAVNEAGQYVLRELLEGNKSRTHRQMIRKDGVLFILVVDAGSTVTETLLSRAHVVLDTAPGQPVAGQVAG